jgi:hypothetical protein
MYWNKVCVIAASNSVTKDGQALNYIELANIAAERVKYYLGLPVLLLTNDLTVPHKHMSNFTGLVAADPLMKTSQRKMLAGKETIQYDWKNDLRVDAYDTLKDYADRILMIDADYMIATDQLKSWVYSDQPFHIFNHVVDTSGRDVYERKHFPSHDIVQRWATAMCWNYSKEAEAVFETAKMVRDNYEFYALMLGMPTAPFRNDLVFSVACHLLNIPESESPALFNLPADSYLCNRGDNDAWLIYNQTQYINVWSGDLHVLNKSYAIDPQLMQELTLHNVPA